MKKLYQDSFLDYSIANEKRYYKIVQQPKRVDKPCLMLRLSKYMGASISDIGRMVLGGAVSLTDYENMPEDRFMREPCNMLRRSRDETKSFTDEQWDSLARLAAKEIPDSDWQGIIF